jgi:hypothetical protein
VNSQELCTQDIRRLKTGETKKGYFYELGVTFPEVGGFSPHVIMVTKSKKRCNGRRM